ncbi:MAG TPA: SRPBCC domain-containing protein [Tepidisphaeraceae bacterium]|nr:SRPBCC domain-containing protein [Tepidisphaeraceae bacterium]
MNMIDVESQIKTLEFTREQRIEAPMEIVFEAVLDEMGPASEGPPGTPMPMKLEAWPGGRWFRDLGNNAGHLWGHVQVIKPPALLEICGSMFMSYPAANHLSYRLKADGKSTVLTLTHRAIGLIPDEHIKGVRMGWNSKVEHIVQIAMKRNGSRAGSKE